MSLDTYTSPLAALNYATPTAPFHIPRICRADHCCDASVAAARLELAQSPPDWLHDLNVYAERFDYAPAIETMTMKEAEEYFARHHDEWNKKSIQCVLNAMNALAPLKLGLQNYLDAMSYLLTKIGKGMDVDVTVGNAHD